MNPELVVLEGEGNITDEHIELARAVNSLNDFDLDRLLKGEFYPDDSMYLENKYPEMMGIAVTAITSVIGAVGGLVSRIAKRVRARRNARRKRKSQGNAQRKQAIQQQNMIRAIAIKNQQDKKKQMNTVYALVGVGLLAYLL